MHRGCAAPDASLSLWERGSARGWGTGTMEGGRERGAGVGSLLVIFQASWAPLFELDVKCEASEMPPRWCLSWRHSRMR